VKDLTASQGTALLTENGIKTSRSFLFLGDLRHLRGVGEFWGMDEKQRYWKLCTDSMLVVSWRFGFLKTLVNSQGKHAFSSVQCK
jgi:hypothetical protein